MNRLRVGILLFVVSWLPIAQVALIIAHNNDQLTDEHASSVFRLSVWTIQFIIGLIGIWLAGRIALGEAREEGWKRTPKRLWHLFWQGEEH
jgi:hypothetical protein